MTFSIQLIKEDNLTTITRESASNYHCMNDKVGKNCYFVRQTAVNSFRTRVCYTPGVAYPLIAIEHDGLINILTTKGNRMGDISIYLPVFTENAYLYIGDGHALQGDG